LPFEFERADSYEGKLGVDCSMAVGWEDIGRLEGKTLSRWQENGRRRRKASKNEWFDMSGWPACSDFAQIPTE
jgi:hypothetical protein